MKLRMHENSLFAILLRSPWWVSFLIAAGLVLASRAFLPDLYAVFTGLPFFVIGAVAAWRQLRAPSADKVAERLDAVRAMPWDQFAAAVEAGYRRAGYAVSRLAGEAGDFELEKDGRRTLVACKRWKALRTGIEPLKQAQAARRQRDAYECVVLAAGEVTQQARDFAVAYNIRLVQGAELVRLLS